MSLFKNYWLGKIERGLSVKFRIMKYLKSYEIWRPEHFEIEPSALDMATLTLYANVRSSNRFCQEVSVPLGSYVEVVNAVAACLGYDNSPAHFGRGCVKYKVEHV